MRVVCVANQKGGCAKTTTVVNLAAALAERGFRVLVIDLDPQLNATIWLGLDVRLPGVDQLFEPGVLLSNLVQMTNISNLWAIAGSKKLAHLEKQLAGEVVAESILKQRFSGMDFAAYDFVLFDTPPTLGLVTLNAMVASEYLLVPVSTHVLSLHGVAQLLEKYKSVETLLNPRLKILGYLPSRVDSRTRHSQEVLQILKDRFGSLVFNSFISENIKLAEAPSFSMPILSYKPKSKASEDFRMLVNEVLERTSMEE